MKPLKGELIVAEPFRGGAITALEAGQLKSGQYSMIQNLRQKHPGLEQRKGMSRLHTTANGVLRVVSMFMFAKGRTNEFWFMVQWSDGTLQYGTSVPPSATTGAFGSTVFTGSVNPATIVASYVSFFDLLLYTNGNDPVQIWGGGNTYPKGVHLYMETATIPIYPTDGYDYTSECTDGDTGTSMPLTTIGTDSDQAILVCCEIVPHYLYFYVGTANTNSATPSATYWNGSAWSALTVGTDSTSVGGKTLAQTGAYIWSSVPTDWKPCYLYGKYGYWTKITFSAALGSNPTITGVLQGSLVQNMANLWDGVLRDAVQIQVERDSKSYTYGGSAALLGGMSGNDFYFAATDPVELIYIDVGGTPHETIATTDVTAPVAPALVSVLDADSDLDAVGNVYYGYKVTFVTALGETEGSATEVVYCGNGSQHAVNVYVSETSDTSVIARKVYRSEGQSSAANALAATCKLLTTIAGNGAFTYYDKTADATLGADAPTTNDSGVDAPAAPTISAFYYWNGTDWASIGTFTDGTSGLTKSGFINVPRNALTQETERYGIKAYWYKVSVTSTVSPLVTIGIQYVPYFNITRDFGDGYSCCSWAGRMAYTFTRYGDYVYVSSKRSPQALNGDDFGILQAGDGRSNPVVCMKEYESGLLTFQAEIGAEGGCLSLFTGSEPTTWTKTILSTRLGAMNANCVTIVDGVLVSTETLEVVKKLVFALSLYGIYMTDGKTCTIISDDIRNYFDTSKTECVAKAYSKRMWLSYDPSSNTLRAGLVSGDASVCNVFPVYDLIDKTWSFDSLGHGLSCQINMGTGGGTQPMVQVGGGNADGYVYLLNTGTNDVSTAVTAYATVEINLKGLMFVIRELLLRVKAQTGDITLTPYINGVAQTAKTLSMLAEVAGQSMRRHRFDTDWLGHHISLKFSHSGAGESMLLIDYGYMPVDETRM